MTLLPDGTPAVTGTAKVATRASAAKNTTTEAADLLGVTRRRVTALVGEGFLPAVAHHGALLLP